MRWQPNLKIIPHYESEPLYIEAIKNSIEKKISEISWKPDLIIAFDWMTSFYLRRIAKIHNITFINASISDANRKISLRKLNIKIY